MQDNNPTFDERREEACYAQSMGWFEKAFNDYHKLFQEGDSRSALPLGNMYLEGKGVQPNVEKGLNLLLLAASLGCSTAAFNLGSLHRTGACNVPKDAKLSRHFFFRARELGCKIPVDDYI